MKIEEIEKEMIKLLKKAERKEEVPVGAIIVRNNKIISKAYNKVEKKKSVLYHAEIIAIKQAMKKLKNWRLNNCTLYVSLEPCEMCSSIIKKSRIEKVVFFSKQNKYDTEKEPKKMYIENVKISNILKSFFLSKR